jgi:hypothetical protein
MSGIAYPPPSENLPIFDSSVFLTTSNVNLTPTSGLKYFLSFPNAQGTENLSVTNVYGTLTTYDNIIMDGSGNYIQFPDGSQQTVAGGGGGSGDAVLSAGTSTTPQPFTGVNSFNNAGGIIIEDTTNTTTTTTLYQNGTNLSINSSATGGGIQLGDATALNKVSLSTNANGLALNKAITVSNKTNAKSVLIASDETTTGQLDITGQISIGSSTGGNTVILKSDDTTTGQLDVVGSCSVGGNLIIGNTTNSKTVAIAADGNNDNQLNINNSSILVAGAGYPILLAGYGDSDLGKYGLQVSGGGIYVGNNSGAADSSYFVQIACSDISDGVLFVNGNLNITGTTITLNGATFTSGSTGLIIGQPVTITTNLVLQGTVSGATTSSTLSQSANIIETVQYDGSIQLYGGTNRSIYLNYTGQTDLQIQQNFDEYLQVSSGLTLFPNKYVYPSSTNFINIAADGATNNQLWIEGNLLTTGNIILGSGTTSGASLTFGNGSIQTVAYTGGAPILATYTSSALDTLLTPFVWSFDGISNTLGNQVSWILYSNSAITTNSSSTVFSETNATITPSNLNNYIYGSGTAIQIPYKFDDGTSTTNQKTYYPSVVVALGGFTLDAIGNTSGTTTFTVTLTSSSNTNFTNASTLKLVFYAG